MSPSSPASVRGYMRPSSMSRVISIDAVWRQRDCGCGLIQANFGYCLIKRSSHTLPGSAIPMLDAAAGVGDFVRTHGRVAHQDQLVVGDRRCG